MEQFFVDVATKLGLEAARVWPQAVMITYVVGWFWLVVESVLVLVLSIGGPILWYKTYKYCRINSKDDGFYGSINNDLVVFGVAMVSVLLLMLGLAAFLDIPNNLSAVLYPEAATVLKLLGK